MIAEFILACELILIARLHILRELVQNKYTKIQFERIHIYLIPLQASAEILNYWLTNRGTSKTLPYCRRTRAKYYSDGSWSAVPSATM